MDKHGAYIHFYGYPCIVLLQRFALLLRNGLVLSCLIPVEASLDSERIEYHFVTSTSLMNAAHDL